MENNPHQLLTGLSVTSVGCFALGGLNAGLGTAYFCGLGLVAAHYAWQMNSLNIEDRETCWNLFQSNRWLGLVLLFSIMGGKYQLEQKKK